MNKLKKFELETELVNLTPHTISIFDKNTDDLIEQIEPSGTVARAGTVQDHRKPINGVIPTILTYYKDDVEGLPDQKPHTLYIVSGLVKAAEPYRTDLVQPADLKRDAQGRVVGCYALSF